MFCFCVPLPRAPRDGAIIPLALNGRGKMPAVELVHETDPREVLQNKVGSLDDIDVFANDVLVAIYIKPEAKSKGGILIPGSDEDKWQGKVGLIVKMGSMAFKDAPPDTTWRDEDRCQVGDWVFFRGADSWNCTLPGGSQSAGKIDARIVQDTLIRGRVRNPDAIY